MDQNRKKRILWVSEACFLNTGFAVVSKAILEGLHQTEKYEIGELGSYAKSSDLQASSVPWKFYGGIPEDDNHYAREMYSRVQTAQFGQAVFEQVCLDFKPDIVIDIRDPWMDTWQLQSPFRDYYKLLWMPTIDGEPQRAEWIDDYSRVDSIVTYSKYAKDTLEKEAPGKIKINGRVSPGVDHKTFIPMDKIKLRKEFNIPENANIIITVMRNQKRKLYPDLMEMFAGFIQYCKDKGNEALAQNTYLYMHTSYPDVGYDLGKYVMANGIGHRCLFTYQCEHCRSYYSDYFQTEISVCKNCASMGTHMPNTSSGLDRESLAKIINLADVYIQYSVAEGQSLPIAEAKSCGVPAMAVDYSAMSEQVQVEGCQPIKVGRFFYEPVLETEQKRALPDNQDAIEKLYNFFLTSKEDRERFSKLARQDVIDNYSFERSVKVFEKAIDSLEIEDHSKTWDNPVPNLAPLNKQIPQFTSNADFVDWCIDNILGRPELKDTYWRNDTIKSLNTGWLFEKAREDLPMKML